MYALSSQKGLVTFGSPGNVAFATLKCLEEWGATINGLRDKSGQGWDTPGKALNVLDRLGYCHVQDSLDLLWVGLNTSLADHEAKEFAGGHPKCTLGGVEPYPILLQNCEHGREVGDVLVSRATLDEHVININLHGVTNQWSEYAVHQTLIRSPDVLEAEGHDFVA
ncbi:unnamed protein product [Prunus armeniaca]